MSSTNPAHSWPEKMPVPSPGHRRRSNAPGNSAPYRPGSRPAAGNDTVHTGNTQTHPDTQTAFHARRKHGDLFADHRFDTASRPSRRLTSNAKLLQAERYPLWDLTLSFDIGGNGCNVGIQGTRI